MEGSAAGRIHKAAIWPCHRQVPLQALMVKPPSAAAGEESAGRATTRGTPHRAKPSKGERQSFPIGVGKAQARSRGYCTTATGLLGNTALSSPFLGGRCDVGVGRGSLCALCATAAPRCAARSRIACSYRSPNSGSESEQLDSAGPRLGGTGRRRLIKLGAAAPLLLVAGCPPPRSGEHGVRR